MRALRGRRDEIGDKMNLGGYPLPPNLENIGVAGWSVGKTFIANSLDIKI
jgi:hypothetical protein